MYGLLLSGISKLEGLAVKNDHDGEQMSVMIHLSDYSIWQGNWLLQYVHKYLTMVT